jgi:hypothetical protein
MDTLDNVVPAMPKNTLVLSADLQGHRGEKKKEKKKKNNNNISDIQESSFRENTSIWCSEITFVVQE